MNQRAYESGQKWGRRLAAVSFGVLIGLALVGAATLVYLVVS